MCVKIKCKDSEQWGRSAIIATLADVLYKDYFVDTKRNVLDEVNSQILYETFPEGKDKGSCALNKNQQETQHNTVKNAVMNKTRAKNKIIIVKKLTSESVVLSVISKESMISSVSVR